MSKIEQSIATMRQLAAIPVHYDMGDRYGNDADRDGRIEYDCSSAVSKAVGLSLNNNTESLKANLPKIGYTCVYDGVDGSFDAQRGDVVIWGPRDYSSSLGAFGHVVIMTGPNTMIHCNYGYDGVTENDYNQIWFYNGQPRETVYRLNGDSPLVPETPKQHDGLKIYRVDDLQFVNGIWQVKCDDLVPTDFDWTDNGISVGDIDLVDENGKILDNQETEVGSLFVINPDKVISDGEGAYGSGNYYWRHVTLQNSGQIWLSVWDVNHLLHG